MKIYQIDAFATKVFEGNPAAVCPLVHWLDDNLLQNIAMENNLAETAYYVYNDGRYEIRWFTPTVEVDLCGHATLAAAFVLFFEENFSGDTIHFFSHRSGPLSVTRTGDLLTLDFPADTLASIDLGDELMDCFDILPLLAFKGKTDYMLVFADEKEILQAVPANDRIASLDARGVIITARGSRADFVSRFFAPQSGVFEDHVTGSAHTTLTPYWAEVLGKTEMTAVQLSARRGYLQCRNCGDRVEISGHGRLYMKGQIYPKQ